MERRFAYRCRVCLCVFVLGERLDTKGRDNKQFVASMGCGVCDVEEPLIVEYLGPIGVDNKTVKTEVVCKCDDRCVWACGPKCSCECRGANHMAGPLGYTQIEVVGSKVKFKSIDYDTSEKHRAIAEEYTKAVAEAEERRASIEVLFPRQAASEKFAFRKALKQTQHWRRIKTIEGLFR